ncbi:MAG: Ppx/GppA family phosphatase [Bifidobacteriaceae bacterium]|jgi:exopolyphosphatase/guanosine-5'-triphosphate,3'-diphosphate pyrophosphatase|nr:Ppx/GppA family phosphatase [Bifidobacteriaceae bacterium]
MTGTVRAAGIDCGTNSMRLLIADVDLASGRPTDVRRHMEIVRLGQGVDRTGWFAPEALERAAEVIRWYAELCREAGCEAVRVVATSAARDAANRNVFLDGVRTQLGVEAEVIDGLEEACLSFTGALASLRADLPGPYLCVDLGGGSTEFALGQAKPTAAYSMDVGCVRITERHLRSDPPTAGEIRAAERDIDHLLDLAAEHLPLGSARTVVGLAGSITSVTAHALGLADYSPEQIDGAELTVEQLLAACEELWTSSRAVRSRLAYMHPGRVDVIGAGALVWSRVLLRLRAEVEAAGGLLERVITSEHDILDGLAISAARAFRDGSGLRFDRCSEPPAGR